MNVIDFQKANCRNCYKCVRSCSVKAIRIKNEQAQIMNEHCILCGHCLEVCPQNAKTFSSDLDRVKAFLRQGQKTVISIAPSYLGVMKFREPGQVVTALKKLGFKQVRETAEGAAYVTNAYYELMQEGKMKNIISTCCPSVNDLVEKYYPDLTPFMAPVVSPMVAHGMIIKKLLGMNTKVIFLGPCIAKKEEAELDKRTSGWIDGVINFAEMEEWLVQSDIDVCACEPQPMDNPDPKVNRLYPVSSGIITSVMTKRGEDSYRKLFVDGLDNCIELFRAMERGELDHCFIEANVCDGGCIKGPAISKMDVSRFKAKLDIEERIEYAAPDYPEKPEVDMEKQFYSRVEKEKMPTEEEIRRILRKTGKYSKEDELDCGACGYSSCREKAIAVFQEKAELGMCLPYAYERASSMANTVLERTPNVILVVDGEMQIKEFNQAAENMFKISKSVAQEKYLFELIDHTDFLHVYDTHEPIVHKRVAYEELGVYTMQTLVYVKEQDAVLGIFQDVTEEENNKKKHYQLQVETVEMAQRVIDKQMMVAQEIAGLLGETTAETKVTLTKLRDSILFEDQKE